MAAPHTHRTHIGYGIRRWPDDLRQWYRLHNGASSQELFTGVLPGYAELLSLQQIPTASREYDQIFDEAADEDDGSFCDAATLERSPAGKTAWRFLPSWVPIAEEAQPAPCSSTAD